MVRRRLGGGRNGVIVTQLCPTLCEPIDFPRQEYWSGLPFPTPGDLPYPGIEPRSFTLQADSLSSEPLGKPDLSPKSDGVMLVGKIPLAGPGGWAVWKENWELPLSQNKSTGKTDFVWLTSSSPWGKGWGGWKLSLYLGSVVGGIGKSVSFPKSTF